MKKAVTTPFGRRRFLAGAGAGIAAVANLPALPADAQAAGAQPAPPDSSGAAALVLSGGAARGAYQAGVIAGLAETLGISDGQPLPYEMIAGTSIGALNGYFAATAQYSTLLELWRTIPSRNILRPKPQYAKIMNSNSGLLNRLQQAISLGVGLNHDVLGVLDRAPFTELMHEVVTPSTPIHIPFYWTSTNITYRRDELFFRPGTTSIGQARQARVAAALQRRPGRVPRPVPDSILIDALMASATIPLAFDPIELPPAHGNGPPDLFIDGGVTNNAAVGIAQRAASLVQGILVDPVFAGTRYTYANAVDLATGIFETMEWSIVQYAVLLSFAESTIVSGGGTTSSHKGFDATSVPLRLELIRPEKELPTPTADFNDYEGILEMIELGRRDAHKGWNPFSLATLMRLRDVGA